MSSEISRFASALTSSNVTERMDAAQQLSRLGDSPKAAAVSLVRAVADDCEQVSQWAVAALEDLGPPDPNDLDAIAALLADTNSDIRYWAATLLGRLGAVAAPAVGQLAAVFSGKGDPSTRQQAAWALGKIGPGASSAAEVLKQAAASDDTRLARLARTALDAIQV